MNDASQRRDWTLWTLLCVVLVVNLLSLPALRYDGDAIAWEMEAESLVYRGRLAVDPAIAESQKPGAPYFLFNRGSGNSYSKYGIGNTLVYALPLLFERMFLSGEAIRDPSQVFGKPGTGSYTIDRRVGLLGGFNILLSSLLAWVLYRFAGLYTKSRLISLGFVLACFYSTFLWNYLRAQSSQIYQCLFFSLALLHLLRYSRSARETGRGAGEGRDLVISALALAALCLVKLVYLPLFGVWAIGALLAGWRGDPSLPNFVAQRLRSDWKFFFACALPPIVAMIFVILLTNEVKFGSFLSMGYERETNLWGGRLSESIPGYLFHPRYSIFIHFPVLVIALCGIPVFWKRHRFDLLISWGFFAVMFAINSNYTFWKGEACVGPRYLLFALPALSAPLIAVVEGVAGSRSRYLLAGLVIAVLGVSSAAQSKINALEFHTFFRLRILFERSLRDDPEVFAYFNRTNTAVVNADFIDYRDDPDRGELPLPLMRARDRLSAQRFEDLETVTRGLLTNNYYFW